ncbi:MAG: citrate synthase [Planctomycetota bacterium]|nr:MAG: citrate synthase [Planctomycetota bacterium]REJ95245.1 MAG: citrate synthase [Planctomycetota bacterium]REK27019.1 MAG: citrate synthase [Planctomycetota bacterium]REK40318.1 MAG: citrate synthase [Planctomycetota bacterium]
MSELHYRPGLEGIVAGETAISTISDGLRYRGYSIEDLASHAGFEEVAYLILHGALPNAEQLAEFRGRLASGAAVSGHLIDFLRKIPASAGAMDVMRTGASALAHWDPEAGDNSHEANLRKAERLLAQLPTIMAAWHRLRHSQEPVSPDGKFSFAANLLWMLHRAPPKDKFVRAMDVSLTLYAEHEFNASTFTARVVVSTLSDLHSAIAAAIGALKGPLHGGANERVLEVLQQVGSKENAEPWVREALANKVRIMGFGHRVYKAGDPRAAFLKAYCAELAAEKPDDDLEEIAGVIEEIVVGEKGLPPNLDWPSARLYHYMGLPVELYTPLFVVSRVVGWSAHAIEQLDNNRLIRPRSNYTGPGPQAWVAIEDR